MLANSEKTAIGRKQPSAPCRWLAKQGKIVGQTIDWGCGRGADCRALNCRGYDPHFHPLKPHPDERFDTILLTYVLNVIPDFYSRCYIIADCINYLSAGGWLYVTIRSDNKSLNGYTKKGTWQGYVGDQLELGEFELIHKTSHYEIWGWQAPQ